jgi:hypothetical protein
LDKWRDDIWERDHCGAGYSSTVILSNPLIELLSSIGPIWSQKHLSEVLDGWGWWDTYGAELYQHLSHLNIPPLRIIPSEKSSKRKAPPQSSADDTSSQSVSATPNPTYATPHMSQKRPRLGTTTGMNTPQSTPITSFNPYLTPASHHLPSRSAASLSETTAEYYSQLSVPSAYSQSQPLNHTQFYREHTRDALSRPSPLVTETQGERLPNSPHLRIGRTEHAKK